MAAVEHIGSGIKRNRGLCSEYGVTEPIIEVSEHWLTVSFPRPNVEEKQEGAEPVSPEATDLITGQFTDGGQLPTQSATRSERWSNCCLSMVSFLPVHYERPWESNIGRPSAQTISIRP